ncbi:ABC transporter substrate-binding protein [Magnetospirillum sp. SS-4]|uniref:ABC transporter substrate-binding protein n=1 Tax=Magnetospirillum sp. SS-4 TaxID=2681465 RepID=UPI00137D004F|nr:ABC transporter substrate-binding protein [Magnetospirillum sp. SS-4]CAA7612257.1 ABC-type branched-chain amino acid transport system protein [Magnetospirillum sp. SS-4]
MSVSRRFLLGTAAAVLAILPFKVQAADPIRIGAVLSITGPASLLGDPEAKVLKMYVDQLNKEGGVADRKIDLITYDDEGKADKTLVLVRRLIEADKVSVIIGPTLTGNTMAVIQHVEREQVPMISIAGGGVIVDPVKKWVFKTPHTDKMATEKVFMDMKKRGISKIALIYGLDGYGKSASNATKELAPSHGISILADEVYGPADVDMTAQLTKIKNTPGVQAVFNLGFGQSAAITTKNYKQLGIGLPFYESHGVNSKSYIDLAGIDATNGVRLPASAVLVAEQLPANDPQKAVTMKFKTETEAAFKTEVSTFGGHAYDALQIALSAVVRAGSTDRARIRDEIEKTSGYIGTSGVVSMSPTDHLGLTLSSLRLLEIKNGQWTLVD